MTWPGPNDETQPWSPAGESDEGSTETHVSVSSEEPLPKVDVSTQPELTVRVPRSPGQPPPTEAWHKGTALDPPPHYDLALQLARDNQQQEMGIEQQAKLRAEKKQKSKEQAATRAQGKGKSKKKKGKEEKGAESIKEQKGKVQKGKKSSKPHSTPSSPSQPVPGKRAASTTSSQETKRHSPDPQDGLAVATVGGEPSSPCMEAYADLLRQLPQEAQPQPGTRGSHNYTLTIKKDSPVGSITVRTRT